MTQHLPIAVGGARVKQTEPSGRSARTTDDHELFARFLGGDDEAFMEIFDRHTARLGSYCRKMVGHAGAAEDLMQDVWERVIRMRSEDRPPPPNPLGLIFWMARNLCLNFLRDRHQHASLDDLPVPPGSSAGVNDPSQLEELVVMALDRIPLQQREILILNAYSGYSFEEIAQMTDENVGAIRTRAWRARRQLKRVIVGLIELDGGHDHE
jgi:RNA polymerase sigma-70 factor (ECF subfamily)